MPSQSCRFICIQIRLRIKVFQRIAQRWVLLKVGLRFHIIISSIGFVILIIRFAVVTAVNGHRDAGHRDQQNVMKTHFVCSAAVLLLGYYECHLKNVSAPQEMRKTTDWWFQMDKCYKVGGYGRVLSNWWRLKMLASATTWLAATNRQCTSMSWVSLRGVKMRSTGDCICIFHSIHLFSFLCRAEQWAHFMEFVRRVREHGEILNISSPSYDRWKIFWRKADAQRIHRSRSKKKKNKFKFQCFLLW